MEPIAEISLWCVRKDNVIPFVASVSTPYQEDQDWRCKVSLGNLSPDITPLYQVNSMLCLVGAIHYIVVFLKLRADQGDKYYFDSDLTDEITDISELFWNSKVFNTTQN